MVKADPAAAVEARRAANEEAFRRLCDTEPVLIDVQPAIDVLPDMTRQTVLTSGAPLDWEEYVGGQRDAIIGGALYEGLASSPEEADAKFSTGELVVGSCHDYGCVGSLAGIYTASMPVFVVEDEVTGRRGFCNFYEGNSPRRLNYGIYDDEVRGGLQFIEHVLAPVIGDAVRLTGGIPLRHLMSRALHMGDELHSRNTAATLLFERVLIPAFLDVAAKSRAGVDEAVQFLYDGEYFFLRLSMAAAKVIADTAHGVEASSVVSAMTFSSCGFSVRVSGLGDGWFRGPHATAHAELFEGHTADEITWMGGESPITETVGVGGFAQACAFPLQRYQGGSPQLMIERNLAMYEITVGENTTFRIPFFEYRGTPTGIDVFRVLEKGILPVMDVGIAGRDGGQIGAGVIEAPIECFEAAADAYRQTYGSA